MSRYTAEFRGGDNGELPWGWCVVDEEEGLFGSAIYFNLTESEARVWADIMNELHKDGRMK